MTIYTTLLLFLWTLAFVSGQSADECHGPHGCTSSIVGRGKNDRPVTLTASRVHNTELWTIKKPTTLSNTKTVYPGGYRWVPASKGPTAFTLPTKAPWPTLRGAGTGTGTGTGTGPGTKTKTGPSETGTKTKNTKTGTKTGTETDTKTKTSKTGTKTKTSKTGTKTKTSKTGTKTETSKTGTKTKTRTPTSKTNTSKTGTKTKASTSKTDTSKTGTKTRTATSKTGTKTKTATSSSPSGTKTSTKPKPSSSSSSKTNTEGPPPTSKTRTKPRTSTGTSTKGPSSSKTKTKSPTSTDTSTKNPSSTDTSTENHPPTKTTKNNPPTDTSTSKNPPPTDTSTKNPPSSTGTETENPPPTGTNTKDPPPPPSTRTNDPPPPTGTETNNPPPPTGTNTEGPPPGTNTEGPPPGTNTEGPPPGTNTQGPPPGTNTQGPPPGTNTEGPPPGTNTQGPPPGTNTQGPPPGTNTQGPPPGTNTEGPPPGTNTEGPPPGTNTQGPPPGTNTQGPPPGTNTENPPPPTGTGTDTPTSRPPITSKPTTDCTATPVPTCTKTLSETTSYFETDGTRTSTVKTATATSCTTLTTCDLQGTTSTTTTATTTSQAFVCDATCQKCGNAAVSERDLPNVEDASRHLIGKRHLEELDSRRMRSDLGRDRYVKAEAALATLQLDWNTVTTNVVTKDTDFPQQKKSISTRGIFGCTGIAIVSEKGAWMTHLMEPGFIHESAQQQRTWQTMVDELREGPKSPFSVADSRGLTKGNEVKIYFMTPRKGGTFEEPTLLYKDRIDELTRLLTGSGQAFEGVEVVTRGYEKPTEAEMETEDYKRSARGIFLVEYDPVQVEDPLQAIYRVWIEAHPMTPHLWKRPCGSSSQKRDISCPINQDPDCNPSAGHANPVLPELADQMASRFCNDLSFDFKESSTAVIKPVDIPGTNPHGLHSGIKFLYELGEGPDCSKSCDEIYHGLIKDCEYDSHDIYGSAMQPATCGNYSMEIVPIKPPPFVPEITNQCADPTIYTSFNLDDAEAAIEDFCSHPESELALPDAAAGPVWKTYYQDEAVLQLIMSWSMVAGHGCHSPEKFSNRVTQDECRAHFKAAVNNCNTDTQEYKYGNMPMTWNSPIGCIDFSIYGNGADWECPELGFIPMQCLHPPPGTKLE